MVDCIQDHDAAFWWLTVFSIVTFLASLVLVPWFVVRMPVDYFADPTQRKMRSPERRAEGIAFRIGKNVLGYLFILAGILMLVLPGQGIITILIGITLANFPGKYRLERWLFTRGPVRRSLNWLRKRAGRPQLEF